MKVLLIGDPHFMISNINETRRYTKKIVALIKSEEPRFIVVLGDVFHTHEKKHILVEKEVTHFLKSISDLVKTYLLVGNHDMINSQQFLTTNHAFTAYRYWENLVICEKPVYMKLDDKQFIFTPFVPPGRLIEALETLISNHDVRSSNEHLNTEQITRDTYTKVDCIFAHQEIYGCRFNPTTLSEDGDRWLETNPMLISGHIHDEQWVGDNVYYPGSSMQHGFSESGEKIVAIADFGEKISFERFDLGMRRKRIMYVNVEDLANITIPENENIKLVIKGTAEEIKTIRKREDYHELTDKVKVSFIPKEISIKRDSRKKSVIEILKDLVNDEPENVKAALGLLLGK